jgi:hypothetical protein
VLGRGVMRRSSSVAGGTTVIHTSFIDLGLRLRP